jgi:Tol biopolymer transport system component
MSESHPPTHRGLHRHLYQRRTWWGRVLILLSAILVLVAPLSAAGQAPQPASIGGTSAPRISFQKLYVDGTGRGEILTASADGRGGVRQLVTGVHNQEFCQSADGRKIAYYSDQETPHQFLPYVANAGGANAQKIHAEPSGEVVCPFSERWLLLGKCCGGCNGPWAIVRHDLQTGAEETVATNVDARLSLSPDGNKLLFVGGLDYTPVPGRACPAGRETLYVLDLTTLDRRRLAGPLARGTSFGVACFGHELQDARRCAGSWSPDGRRIAYTIGPSIYDIPTAGEPPVLSRARPYAVYVQPAAGGAARRVLRFSGGPPSISWSPDGGRLLVCANNRGRSSSPDATGCSGGGHAKDAGKLLLVGVARGSVRRVASGEKLVFAQWAPSGGAYAYATPAAVYVARPDGARRLLAAAPKPLGSGGRWMGWSPDGSYIGLGSCRGRLAVLDTTTGRIRVLFRERKGEFKICEARWWR